jgi:hypothetical protein
MRSFLCVMLLATVCRAQEPSPPPSPARMIGRLDVEELEKNRRNNWIIGNSLGGVGAVVGAAGLALMLTGYIRECPMNMPGCNDAISTAGTWVGAVSLVFVSVGAGFFAVSLSQKKILKQIKTP